MSNTIDEETIDLNVVIIPPLNIAQELIKVSETLKNTWETMYVLGGKRKPHFSLYSACYPSKNMRKVTKSLKLVAKESTGVLRLKLQGFYIFSGYVFFDIVNSPELMSLHNAVVDTLNPFREGLVSDVMKGLTGLSQKQRQAIEEYGYVSVKDSYMPHISLTKLSRPRQDSAAVLKYLRSNVEPMFFDVTSISTGPFGPMGTLPKTDKSFSLGDFA
jgi:2'-5' RNA ligase